MAVGVWSPELSEPWQISGLTKATHRALPPPGAAALTGVGVRGLWRDREGWGGGRNLTAAGGQAAGGGTLHLLEGFLVAVEVRLGGGRAGEKVGPICAMGTNLQRESFHPLTKNASLNPNPPGMLLPSLPSPHRHPQHQYPAHLFGPPSRVGRDGADHLGREDGGAAGRTGLR